MNNLRKFILRLIFIFSFSCLLICKSYAQDSSHLRISLLTCTQGEELYATFGHSALRVIDSSTQTDRVYNYGTFNFDDEGFYLKFIRGQLKYYVSVDDFYNFKYEYQMSNRGMTEQVLNFSGDEKQGIRRALNENLLEENRFYLYDFFLDNCTTRLRDLIIENHQPAPVLPAVMPVNFTFRNAIHQYLNANHKYWSKLGIDILLGAPTDAVMTPAQQQFLPDNLMLALDSCSNTKMVQRRANAYSFTPEKNAVNWFTPMIVFALIFLFFTALSLFQHRVVKFLLRKMDAFLFFSVGLLGIVLILMWAATDHSMTKNNYNLLWAWPTHIVYAFFMNRSSKRVRTYSSLTAIFLFLVFCCWWFMAQEMNNALLPLVLLLIYRSAVRGVYKNNPSGLTDQAITIPAQLLSASRIKLSAANI